MQVWPIHDLTTASLSDSTLIGPHYKAAWLELNLHDEHEDFNHRGGKIMAAHAFAYNYIETQNLKNHHQRTSV